MAKREAEQKQTSAHNRVQTRINFLTLVAVVIYSGLTLWLACTSKQAVEQAEVANKESRDRFRQEERPWIAESKIPTDPNNPSAGAEMNLTFKTFPDDPPGYGHLLFNWGM